MSTFHQTVELYALLPLLKPRRPPNHLPEGPAVTNPHPGTVLFEPSLHLKWSYLIGL